MAKITRNTISVKDPMGDIRESAEKAEKTLIGFSKGLKKVIELQAKVASNAKKTAKGFTELAAAERKSVKALTEKEKIDKKIINLQTKMSSVTKLQRERLASLRIEEQRRNKVANQSAILANKNIGAFEKLGVKVKLLSDKYRNLLVQEGKETRQTRLLRKEILALNKVRNTANENLGNHQNKVGQYTKTIGKLRGGLAQLGLAFGVFQLLRNTLGIVTDFDSAMTNLAAISGKTAEEIAPLKQQALDLGATTQNTASEIAALQLELAKLGFTSDEIMASTGGIQKFALATGADIPDAAKVAGSAMRAFGLEASDMDRIVSVLAVATTKTALDFGFLQTAMSTIAPVANAFGFSIEDTTALLGQLANAGFDASSAATATRNILLNLADANGALAKELGRPITSADDLAGALFELQEKGVDLATALELTDKRSVAAFETFLSGSDSLVELRDSITGVTGELDEMSAKKLDSISGATDLLKSAWEGLVLEWNEGAGFGEALKNVLVFLAKNLRTIVRVLITAVKFWALYKIQLALVSKEMKGMNWGQFIAHMKGVIKNIPNMIKGLRATAFSFKSIGTAIKSIPFAAVLSFLITIVPLVWDWVDGLFAATDATDDLTASERVLQEVQDKTSRRLIDEQAELKAVFEALKATTAGTHERQLALKKVNERYGLTLKNLKDERDFVNQIDAAYKSLLATMKEKIRLEVVQEKLTELLKKQLAFESSLIDLQEKQALKRLDQGVTERTIQISAVGEPLEFKTVFIDAFGNEVTEGGLAENLVAGTQEQIAVIQEQIDALLGKNAGDLDLLIGGDAAPKGEGAGAGKAVDLEKIKLDKLAKLRKDHNTELLELENELIRKGVDKEQREFILSQKKIELLRKEGELIVELDFKDKQILIKHENDYLKFIEDNQISRVDLHKQANKEINDDDLKAAKEKFEREEKARIAREKAEAELWKKIRKDVADAEKLFEQMMQNNIALLDKQAEAEQRKFDDSKTREQELKDDAKEKGLDASESIKVERDKQKAALEEQRKIAEKKMKIEALLVALRLLAAKVEQGQGNPVQNIKSDISSLQSFIEGSFYEGTPYTVADALGYSPGRDSHYVAIDNDESVFTGQQTSDMNIGKNGNSTQDIVDMYKGGILGASVRKSMDNTQIMQPIIASEGNKALISEVKKLVHNTNPMSQKPDKTTFNVVTGLLTYQSKQGGKRTYQTRRKR